MNRWELSILFHKYCFLHSCMYILITRGKNNKSNSTFMTIMVITVNRMNNNFVNEMPVNTYLKLKHDIMYWVSYDVQQSYQFQCLCDNYGTLHTNFTSLCELIALLAAVVKLFIIFQCLLCFQFFISFKCWTFFMTLKSFPYVEIKRRNGSVSMTLEKDMETNFVSHAMFIPRKKFQWNQHNKEPLNN